MGTERRKLNEEIKKAFLRGYIRHEYKKKKIKRRNRSTERGNHMGRNKLTAKKINIIRILRQNISLKV